MSARKSPYRHPPETLAALGSRLKDVREAAGLSLRALANQLTQKGFRIGYGAIGHWETGKNVPDAIWMGHLARLYGIPVDALISGDTTSLEAVKLLANLTEAVRKDMRNIYTEPEKKATPQKKRTG